MFLESLGADASLHELFQPYAARGLVLARVGISHGDQYQLILISCSSSAGWTPTSTCAGWSGT